ncbi:MAG: superoxide dismutase family protein [Planctomycetales bacterium]|nr:superoxide dismutase family protein [Planctomycetales bacterium]
MFRYTIIALFVSTLLFASCNQPAADTKAKPDDKKPKASAAHSHDHDHGHDHDGHDHAPIDAAACVLVPVGENGASGIVRFKKSGDKIAITGTVKGLTPGKHGFHIHEFGDVSDTAKGESAGGHFNPFGHQHGKPGDIERHAGDFGNIEADANGDAKIEFEDKVIEMGDEHSIIGRSLVVHAGEDKFTQPTGDAGPRVAVGVIGIAKP